MGFNNLRIAFGYLGFPTLVPKQRKRIYVGCRRVWCQLSGLLFDAGTVYSPVLLRAADDECWLPFKASAIVPLSKKGVGPDMKVSGQERRLHDAQGHKLGFFAAALGAFAIAAAICNGAMPTPATPESIWPTQEWRTSSPEEEGMDSKELAKLIDWGVGYKFDSLLLANKIRDVSTDKAH